METYSLRRIQTMLGISRAVISGLMDSGFVTPSRGKRGEYRFTFQDVVLLRTAYSLQEARIPPRKILQSLRRLKATLPGELPLTGLRITAVGNEIAVKERQRAVARRLGADAVRFRGQAGSRQRERVERAARDRV